MLAIALVTYLVFNAGQISFKFSVAQFTQPDCVIYQSYVLCFLFNIVFLGLGASALCFVSWNFAVKILGAVNTSIYIYIQSVIKGLSYVVLAWG